jgi:hypothetical protein
MNAFFDSVMAGLKEAIADARGEIQLTCSAVTMAQLNRQLAQKTEEEKDGKLRSD